jgi:hypothetical protein
MEDADLDSGASICDDRPLEREWASRQERSWNAGFAEGLDLAQGELIQRSFSEGFAEASQLGFKIGAVRGALVAMQDHIILHNASPRVVEADTTGDAVEEHATIKNSERLENKTMPTAQESLLTMTVFQHMHLHKGLGLDTARIRVKEQPASDLNPFDLHSALESSLRSFTRVKVPLTQTEVLLPDSWTDHAL